MLCNICVAKRKCLARASLLNHFSSVSVVVSLAFRFFRRLPTDVHAAETPANATVVATITAMITTVIFRESATVRSVCFVFQRDGVSVSMISPC